MRNLQEDPESVGKNSGTVGEGRVRGNDMGRKAEEVAERYAGDGLLIVKMQVFAHVHLFVSTLGKFLDVESVGGR